MNALKESNHPVSGPTNVHRERKVFLADTDLSQHFFFELSSEMLTGNIEQEAELFCEGAELTHMFPCFK